MKRALAFLIAALPVFAAEAENGATFPARGASIYYEVLGAGAAPPLIVVNGGPGFDHTYLHVSSAWNALAKTRRVVFYDQRGNGRSSPVKPGDSCTLADQIDDLDALRARLGFESIDLLGHSWGGFLSMAYAARHPERIRRLIIVDSAAPRWSDTRFLFKDIFPETAERDESLAFATAFGDKAAGADSLRNYLSMLFYSPEKRDRFLAAISPGVANMQVNETVERDLGRFDLNPELRKFRFPTLVLTGRYDINVAPSVAYKIHQAIPASRFAAFERSGHLPFYEEPEEFVRVVEEFLGR